MSTFNTYLRLGYEHILNISALDHVLFIIVLLAVYQPKHWLKMLIAVSLFTLGHSLSLTLASVGAISVDKKLTEFLIPLTIVFTAALNLSKYGPNPQSKGKYWISILFGIIHGLGFSTYYELLVLGEGNYWEALLPFNLGIELGQLIIFVSFLVLTFLGQTIFNIKQRDWTIFFSGLGFGLALLMAIQNIPDKLNF
jgi:hypothetical protein